MASHKLNIYFQNVRGLRTKTHSCFNNILSTNYDIIILVETWLCAGIYNRELCDDRYDVFRFDRDTKATGKIIGGGVMICVRREFTAQCQYIDNEVIAPTEILWISISSTALKTNFNLNIVGTYIRGNYENQPTDIINLSNFLENVLLTNKSSNTNSDKYIIAGDFNLPFIQWEDGEYNFCHKGESLELRELSRGLVNTLTLCGLMQYNNFQNSSGNVLDLIFSNFNIEVNIVTHPLSKVDLYHPPLHLDASDITTLPFNNATITKIQYHKGDYEKINKTLCDIDWQTEIDNRSVDDAVAFFYESLYECIHEYIPTITIKKGKKSYPSWYSKSLVNIMREKNKAHKIWKKYNNRRDYDEFSILRARYHKIHAACYNNYISSVQHSIKKNPKSFWSFVKSRKDGNTYPQSFTYDNKTLQEGPDIADGFSSFFQSTFSLPASNYRPQELLAPQISSANNISGLHVDEKQLFKVLCSTDPNKGAGDDKIPSIFAVKCAKSLTRPLALIFNKSVKEGIFPNKWKVARIVPVHKKGLQTKVENYRPISILNVFSKIFEKLIYSAIYPLIARSIPQEQHGFLRGRSTITNLTLFSKFIRNSMESKCQIDVIYTDFEKAFDRVDHFILLAKLHVLGIHGDLLRWVKSYLTNRSQTVVIGGYRSDYVSIPSGVPQGSLLGPLLYNAFLYDIYTCISHSKFLMYADDTKIFRAIKTEDDTKFLQNDMNCLVEYYRRNRIAVNINKCQVISFSLSPRPIKQVYTMNGIQLNRVEYVRDLGVHLDHKFTFSHHIDTITSKANKSLGFVMRICSSFRDPVCIKNLYFSYVRSILDFASTIWSPNYKKYINEIEEIQKKFTKFINFKTFKSFSSYNDSCKINNLLPLEQRRILLDMLYLYDILNSNIDCPELIGSLGLNVPKKRTRHTCLIHVPNHRTNYGQNETLSRIGYIYNKFFADLDPFKFNKTRYKLKIIQKIGEILYIF